MEQLVYDLESVVILDTVIDYVDLNLLCLNTPEEIQELAEDLEIEITDFNLEDYHNFQHEALEHIYETWAQDVNIEFLYRRKKLFKALKINDESI